MEFIYVICLPKLWVDVFIFCLWLVHVEHASHHGHRVTEYFSLSSLSPLPIRCVSVAPHTNPFSPMSYSSELWHLQPQMGGCVAPGNIC